MGALTVTECVSSPPESDGSGDVPFTDVHTHPVCVASASAHTAAANASSSTTTPDASTHEHALVVVEVWEEHAHAVPLGNVQLASHHWPFPSATGSGYTTSHTPPVSLLTCANTAVGVRYPVGHRAGNTHGLEKSAPLRNSACVIWAVCAVDAVTRPYPATCT